MQDFSAYVNCEQMRALNSKLLLWHSINNKTCKNITVSIRSSSMLQQPQVQHRVCSYCCYVTATACHINSTSGSSVAAHTIAVTATAAATTAAAIAAAIRLYCAACSNSASAADSVSSSSSTMNVA
eukprot:15020-Heterococcus_DN1.PRE.5